MGLGPKNAEFDLLPGSHFDIQQDLNDTPHEICTDEFRSGHIETTARDQTPALKAKVALAAVHPVMLRWLNEWP